MIAQSILLFVSLGILAMAVYYARAARRTLAETERLRAERPPAVRVSINTRCKKCETLTAFDFSDVAAAGHADCPNCGAILLTSRTTVTPS